MDGLTYFVLCKLTDDGVANAEIASKKVRDAFAEFPNWRDSEKELRELRKKVTFAIFAEEDDIDKVTALVDSIFTRSPESVGVLNMKRLERQAGVQGPRFRLGRSSST